MQADYIPEKLDVMLKSSYFIIFAPFSVMLIEVKLKVSNNRFDKCRVLVLDMYINDTGHPHVYSHTGSKSILHP